MSQTIITAAFEKLKAQQAASGAAVVLDGFIFANIPGLDLTSPIDPNEAIPAAAQIVHREDVSMTGVVNENAVVYSVTLGATVGDFDFNWVGLVNKASNTLAMIVHAPAQSKVKNAAGVQGNVLTRSFMMEYDGAKTQTNITTPAQTWQIDFTARLAGVDEQQRLHNVDIYGAGAFYGNGWLVGKNGNQFYVTNGTGYVAGLRAVLAANQNITVTTKSVKVWLDVCWTGTLTSVWAVQSNITVADNLTDYVKNGVQHYVFALASIDASGTITDLRPRGTLNEQQSSSALKTHEQSRNHPDGTTTAKGFVQLSSATNSTSEVLAATPKAVKTAYDLANGKFTAVDATTAKKGIVQLSSATNSTSEVLAATPKAVKTAYDLANGKFTAVDATTARKGIVQLSSATDSTSEVLAATPKAVKAANDNANGRVPSGRKVNGRALTADINVTAQDIFNGQSVAIGTNQNLNNYQTPGLYFQSASANASTALNYPEASAGSLEIYKHAGITQVYRLHSSSRSYIRSLYSGAWSAWSKQYDTANKPSAADVGALPAGGNAVSASKLATARTIGGVSFDGTAAISLPGVNTAGNQSTTGNAATATKLQTARTINGVAFNGSANITISAGAVGSYTKSESDARYLQGVRLGAETSVTMSDGHAYRAPTGNVVTGMFKGGGGNPVDLYFKPIQRNVNGTWVTITG